MRERFSTDLGFTGLSNPNTDHILFWDNSALSLGWLNPDSNFSISTTTLSLASALTITTSITCPTIIGGTGTTSDLTLKTTSGVGATGADMHFLVGNNGATEAMTILNSGNIGIGTTAPDRVLEINSATGINLRLTYNDSNGSATNYVDYLVTSSGNGTITPSGGTLSITGIAAISSKIKIGAALSTLATYNLLIDSDATAYEAAIIAGHATNSSGLAFSFYKSRGTGAIPTLVSNGDELGNLVYFGYNGSAYSELVDMRANIDGTFTSGQAPPSRLVFTTTPANGSATERMRINSTGDISIGTAASAAAKLDIKQGSSTGAIPVLKVEQSDVSEEFIRFVGTSANGILTQSIVEAADVATATVQGYLKVFVQDDGNQLTDQAYFVPIYTLV